MGVSVENDDYRSRIDDLRATGAQVKFLSLEPLLGPLPDLDLRGIDWVIVGGESGPGARPMDAAWVDGHPRPVPRAQACRSSSSSGAARTRSRRAECSTAERGTRCRRRQPRSCPRSIRRAGLARRGDVAMRPELLTGPSRPARPVNRSLPLSTRGHLQRARSRPREPAVARVRVLRIALRDHAANVALAQNPANTGAFKTKPRELPRGASVNCATTFGWWWKKNGSSSWTRTRDPAVNSRLLYRLS